MRRSLQSYLVLTANTLNRLRQTVIVVPLSMAARAHPPVTVSMTYQGKTTVAIIDQLRTVAKYQVHSKIETASQPGYRQSLQHLYRFSK